MEEAITLMRKILNDVKEDKKNDWEIKIQEFEVTYNFDLSSLQEKVEEIDKEEEETDKFEKEENKATIIFQKMEDTLIQGKSYAITL